MLCPIIIFHFISTFLAGSFWKLMNQHPTTMVDSFYLEMMATFTFLQGMVEWLEIHLENLEMPRTSKMVT